MAALAIIGTYIGSFYRFDFAGLDFIMQLNVPVIVMIVLEMHVRLPVTVHTPSHRQVTELLHNGHFIYRPVTFGAIYLC